MVVVSGRVVLNCLRAASAVALLTAASAAVAQTTMPPAQTPPVETVPGQTTGTPDASANAVPPQPVDVAALPSCVADASAYKAMHDRFRADPVSFFDGYVSGNTSLAIPARNVLLIEPGAIDAIIAEMRRLGLETEQAKQIAAGIGQAALMCARTVPQAALAFQDRIAAIDNASVETAFITSTGDVASASIGAGGDGAPGAGAGGIEDALTDQTSRAAPYRDTDDLTPQNVQRYTFQNSAVRAFTATGDGSGSAGVVSPVTP